MIIIIIKLIVRVPFLIIIISVTIIIITIVGVNIIFLNNFVINNIINITIFITSVKTVASLVLESVLIPLAGIFHASVTLEDFLDKLLPLVDNCDWFYRNRPFGESTLERVFIGGSNVVLGEMILYNRSSVRILLMIKGLLSSTLFCMYRGRRFHFSTSNTAERNSLSFDSTNRIEG